jgi:hypothetical protein
MSIFDAIQQQVTAGAVQQVSQRLGIDPAVAQRTVNAAIPVITAALAKHAQSGGADAIHREATKQATVANAPNPLPNILGGEHETVRERVSDVTGVSRDDATHIIDAIAPAVMRGIGQHAQQQGLDAGQLGNVLGSIAGGIAGSRSAGTSDGARM